MSLNQNRVWVGVAVVFALWVSVIYPSVTSATGFYGFGSSPYCEAQNVSADGAVVVGRINSSLGAEAIRWTSAGGRVVLGDLPGGRGFGAALGVSGDGSVVTGMGSSDSGFEAFRWTAADGMVALGDLPGGEFYSDAFGVSADGSTIVGRGMTASGFQAFRWTAAEGMVGLGYLPGGGDSSQAWAASADGSVIVGASDRPGALEEAFRWTAAEGMVGLGDFPDELFHSVAFSVSADGSTIVGHGCHDYGKYEAFRWTATEGMVGLGDLPGGDFFSSACDVSADGSTIIGYSKTNAGNEVFIWDAVHGMRNLRDVLVVDYGLDVADWTLHTPKAISDNGLAICGWGTNPAGRFESWLAIIPEPAVSALLGTAASCLLVLAGRRGRGANRTR